MIFINHSDYHSDYHSDSNGDFDFPIGHDPLTCVVDKNCKAHDLDNLYIVGSGVFVSSAAVNPTLTIVAMRCV